MLNIRFGQAPSACKRCVLEIQENRDQAEQMTRAEVADMMIVCGNYPCELIEEQSKNRRWC